MTEEVIGNPQWQVLKGVDKSYLPLARNGSAAQLVLLRRDFEDKYKPLEFATLGMIGKDRYVTVVVDQGATANLATTHPTASYNDGGRFCYIYTPRDLKAVHVFREPGEPESLLEGEMSLTYPSSMKLISRTHGVLTPTSYTSLTDNTPTYLNETAIDLAWRVEDALPGKQWELRHRMAMMAIADSFRHESVLARTYQAFSRGEAVNTFTSISSTEDNAGLALNLIGYLQNTDNAPGKGLERILQYYKNIDPKELDCDQPRHLLAPLMISTAARAGDTAAEERTLDGLLNVLFSIRGLLDIDDTVVHYRPARQVLLNYLRNTLHLKPGEIALLKNELGGFLDALSGFAKSIKVNGN